MLYECHITTRVSDAEKITQIIKGQRWKTSEIARDPVLGNATFFYLTAHDDNIQKMFSRMNAMVEELRRYNITILREKIELIIHDTKVKV